MTPYKHAVSSSRKFGGDWQDYIALHNWFDETKALTGDWTHRALRHHAAGVAEAVLKFGDTIPIVRKGVAAHAPTKAVAEQHVMEDCGRIPTAQDWLAPLQKNPEPWMLKVGRIETKPLELA